MMRKTVACMLMTLDGVVESPEKWHLRYLDEEMREIIDAAAASSDSILLGRRTYQEFADVWPSWASEVPLAGYMDGTPKHVVSTTLTKLDWINSNLVSGSLADAVEDLKRQAGTNIQIYGSPTLVQSLLRDGLLDELALLVHPIVVGGGRRLFDDGTYGTMLRLVDSRALRNGVLALTYAPARNRASRPRPLTAVAQGLAEL
jgi:dihydrofolate reductase